MCKSLTNAVQHQAEMLPSCCNPGPILQERPVGGVAWVLLARTISVIKKEIPGSRHMEWPLGEPAPPHISACDSECLPLCLRLWGSDFKSLLVFFPYSFLRAMASLSIRNPLQNKFCFPHSLYFTQDAHKQSLQIWQQSIQPLPSDVVTNRN